MPAVQVDGRSIHYLTGPSGLAPGRRSIIFLHGAGGNAAMWQGQRRNLDQGVNTICLDLPGHGQSEGPGCDDIADYSTWLLRFIQTLGLSRLIIGGHSMGGAVVLEAALQRPELMEAVVLIGSGARLRVNPALLENWEDDFATTARKLVRNCYGPETSEEMLGWAVEQLVAESPEVILNDLRACDRFDRMDHLAAIQQPALILCGSEDIMTPPAYSQYLAAQIPRATLTIIQGAGHMSMVEKPGKINLAILKFLASF